MWQKRLKNIKTGNTRELCLADKYVVNNAMSTCITNVNMIFLLKQNHNTLATIIQTVTEKKYD